MQHIIISVDYDEFKPESYRGVVLTRYDVTTTYPGYRFHSVEGFEADLKAAKDKAKELGKGDVFLSSTIDNYKTDLKKSKTEAKTDKSE